MTRIRIAAVVVVAIGAMAASSVSAQEEQWLSYHTTAQAQRLLGGGGGGTTLAPTTARPAGVELPELLADDALFAKWVTPMAADGYLWLAFDRSKAHGPYDRLYIDANGDGSLADETALPPYLARKQGRGQGQATFAPVEVSFVVDDGPVSYALKLDLYEQGNNRTYLSASAACWYGGSIEVAGEALDCQLIDYNANGTFDDQSMNFAQIDRVRLGTGRSAVERFVGKYMQIKGSLYHATTARDGAFITLTPATDVALGAVRVPDGVSQLTLGGLNGVLQVDVADGVGRLPVGKYHVHEWRLEREDDKGVRWQLTAKGSPAGTVVDLAEDNTVELTLGEPLVATVTDRALGRGGQHSFSQTLVGRLGEQIELTRNGKTPAAPKLRIVNEDGSYDKVFRFEYG